MKNVIKFLGIFLLLMSIVILNPACEGSTTGTEMYDGDPDTDEEVPDDMQQKEEEMRQRNEMRDNKTGAESKEEGDASQTSNQED